MPNKHARLPASAAERWMNCPGSVNLGAADGKSTFAAAQGTVAHALAARCLENSHGPGMYLGEKGVIDGHEIECDQEMVDGVRTYLESVAELRCAKEWIEMPLLGALQKWDKDLGGTADYVTYDPSKRLLRVVDFKYGAGKFVAADDNKQLKIYALGAMLSAATPIDTVEVYIVQPRYESAEPVRKEIFAGFDLIEFAGEIAQAAQVTRSAGAPLVAGPWCAQSFCPHAAYCPELEKQQHALVTMEFSNVASLTPRQVSSALSLLPLVKERIKAVEEAAYVMAVAGTAIPGYKLVDKRPRRQWTDTKAVIQWAKNKAIDPYEEPALKSPAQLEKGLKKAEKDEIKQWTVSVSSGTALVPDTDARQSVSSAITVDDFEAIGEAPKPKQLSAKTLFD